MSDVDIVDESDLNRYHQYYDLVYLGKDGKWKRMNVGDTYGYFSHQSITDEADAREMLELYRKGREDWNLRIVRVYLSFEFEEIP